jgi:hypothetical protein
MNGTSRNERVKTFVVLFALAIGCGSLAEAQTNFYTTVGRMVFLKRNGY